MSENLTGPALGNIGEWYSEKWLIDFTRNPEGMIAAGDGQAVCIWNKWKPVLMNSFTHLSNRQIKAIYAFIQEESARQVVVRTAADFDCAALNGEHLHEQGAKSYLFSVYDLTLMNVDMLYAENMPEVSLLVEIEQANQYDDLAVCLVFDQNASVFLESSDAGFVFPFHPAFLPMERVQVYAVGLRNRQFYAGILPANLSHENRFHLDLAPVSEEELLKKIEALDHSVHQGID